MLLSAAFKVAIFNWEAHHHLFHPQFTFMITFALICFTTYVRDHFEFANDHAAPSWLDSSIG